MQVMDLEEQEDGSVLVTLDLRPHEVSYFVELGVIEAIKRGASETKKGIKAKEEESSSEECKSGKQTYHLQEPKEGDEDWRNEVQ